MIARPTYLQTGRLLAVGLSALAMAAPAAPALAGSFQVNPVQIVLQPDRLITSLAIRNAEGQPVSVRVLTYRWTQVNGDDVYTPTDALVASPPIFTIPANGRQLVRVGLRSHTPGAAYRVIFEEIPRPSTRSLIQVALRLNLPMYVLAEPGGAPAVRWSASRDSVGDIVVEGRNGGTARAQVTAIGLIGPAGERTALSTSMGVILPDSMRRWKVGRHPQLGAGSDLQLTIRSSSGEDRITVRLAAR
jgi:fimbrial chaperone protein